MGEANDKGRGPAVDESLTSLAVYFHNWCMFCEPMNNIA